VAMDEKLADEVKRGAPEGRLTCAVALDIAARLRIPPEDVGQAANELGLKIVECQLGCFGRRKK